MKFYVIETHNVITDERRVLFDAIEGFYWKNSIPDASSFLVETAEKIMAELKTSYLNEYQTPYGVRRLPTSFLHGATKVNDSNEVFQGNICCIEVFMDGWLNVYTRLHKKLNVYVDIRQGKEVLSVEWDA